MAVYVNTNVSSLHGRRQLNNVQNQLSTSYQRLSSGMRINSAKDDAAGLQISSRLTSQINGLDYYALINKKALSFDERRAFYFQLRLAEKLYKSIVNRQISLTGTDRAVGGC